jgi:glycosyltransferase involved in cell wall biosynthesis
MNETMKKIRVLIEVPGRVHRIYNTLVDFPPDNFSFEFGIYRGRSGSFSPSAFVDDLLIHSSSVIPLKLLKSLVGSLRPIPHDIDLVYHGGTLDFRNVKWVVDVEDAIDSFRGLQFDRRFFKSVVEGALRKENCKALICHFDATFKSMQSVYDVRGIEQKMVHVPYAVRRCAVKPENICHDNIDILFLGSANFTTPNWFYGKGGHLALKAFLRLQKEFKNVTLTIMSPIPSGYRNILSKEPRIRVIQKPKFGIDFDEILWNSDVCLLPAWITPGLGFLDAMNHQLPVVTVDTYANSEVVRDGKTGFVCKTPPQLSPIRGTWELNTRNRKEVLRAWYQDNDSIVDHIVEAIRVLVRDSDMRKEMGRKGRGEIEPNGRFSIENRNRILAPVLKKALS